MLEEKSIAELAAMRARGEISSTEFEEAKRLLTEKSGANNEDAHLSEPITTLTEQSSGFTKKKKWGCLKYIAALIAAFLVFQVVAGIIIYYNATPEQRAQMEAKQAEQMAERDAERAKREREEAEKKAQLDREEAEKERLAAAKEEETKRKGFHCLSPWDGSHRDLVNSVKEDLRDPSSFEHIETMIAPVNAAGQNTVKMKFRAKNGFGGFNIGLAVGVVNNRDCSLANWRLLSN